MKSMMRAEHVSRCFKTQGGDFWALKDVSLEIPQGKLTILRGRSGSGKTTLLNILSALDQPTEGSVWFQEKQLEKMDEKSRTKLRRCEIGFVFQSVALVPMMTALENVDFALRMAKYPGDRTKRAMECLKMVGMAQRADHMPQELSGGEQQRVAIARAIAHQPKILFTDEPTGALDTMMGLTVVKLFKELTEQEGVTIVMTTHDVGLMELGDRVYELEGGELIHGGE
ncbi:ABC transporter ATP-binding protein [Mediterraneibacter faecis]